MLVDATFDEAMVKAFHGGPQRIGQGLYVGCISNFRNFLPRDEWKGRWSVICGAEHNGEMTLREALVELIRIPAFGIVDSPGQFLELFGEEVASDPAQYAVGFTRITKKDFPSFRWHKNGEYYGTQKPQCECLGDEEDIQEIYTFSVVTRG